MEVAGEGVRVLEADGEEGARFEGLPGEVEERRGSCGRGEEGGEVEEVFFGGG